MCVNVKCKLQPLESIAHPCVKLECISTRGINIDTCPDNIELIILFQTLIDLESI